MKSLSDANILLLKLSARDMLEETFPELVPVVVEQPLWGP